MRPSKLRLPLRHRSDDEAAVFDGRRDGVRKGPLLPMHVVQP